MTLRCDRGGIYNNSNKKQTSSTRRDPSGFELIDQRVRNALFAISLGTILVLIN